MTAELCPLVLYDLFIRAIISGGWTMTSSDRLSILSP